MTGTLYTLGYSGRSIRDVKSAVEAADGILFDIRFNPQSRNPAWNRKSLAAAFGARYQHLPQLGNENYRGSTIVLSDPAAGVASVSKVLNDGQDAFLLCVCKDLKTCHRKVSAELIKRATGCEVVHL